MLYANTFVTSRLSPEKRRVNSISLSSVDTTAATLESDLESDSTEEEKISILSDEEDKAKEVTLDDFVHLAEDQRKKLAEQFQNEQKDLLFKEPVEGFIV